MTPRLLVAALVSAAALTVAPAGADAARRHHPVRALRADWDRDGLTNRTEFRARTNPRRADSDRDGLADGLEDRDGDTLVNAAEQATANDPADRDTDGDGRTDGNEGAGQVLAVDGETVSIALGRPPMTGPIASPAAVLAQGGRVLTGHAVLPEALVCGDEAGYESGDEEGDGGLTDACPPGAFAPGAWVHEVFTSTDATGALEFEEILVVE